MCLGVSHTPLRHTAKVQRSGSAGLSSCSPATSSSLFCTQSKFGGVGGLCFLYDFLNLLNNVLAISAFNPPHLRDWLLSFLQVFLFCIPSDSLLITSPIDIASLSPFLILNLTSICVLSCKLPVATFTLRQLDN